MSQPESIDMDATREQVSEQGLLADTCDTGASCTMLKRPLYKKNQASHSLKLQQNENF